MAGGSSGSEPGEPLLLHNPLLLLEYRNAITHCPGMARRLGPSGGRLEISIAVSHDHLALSSWTGERSPLASMTIDMVS